jgi:hypothetical protein
MRLKTILSDHGVTCSHWHFRHGLLERERIERQFQTQILPLRICIRVLSCIINRHHFASRRDVFTKNGYGKLYLVRAALSSTGTIRFSIQDRQSASDVMFAEFSVFTFSSGLLECERDERQLQTAALRFAFASVSHRASYFRMRFFNLG